MTPRRILFVDDDRAVLDGLENILRRQRRVWEMSFALGGPEAIAALEQSPFDVIVSDMRMPGMDGPALLQIVKDRYPTTARIVLSGQADREAVMRALPVVHQFLAKPCDPDLLRAVVDRTCNLNELLSNKAIRAIVGKLDALPSSQRSFLALSQALHNPDAGLAEIAAIIEEDPAMAAKVLQLVNSAYFGLRHTVTSVLESVRYLGVDLIVSLLLSARVFAVFNPRNAPGFSMEHLQDHSLRSARASRILLSHHLIKEDAFTAALLHDIGQLVFAVGAPSQFGAVLAKARDTGRPLHEVELETFGVSHAEVGAYLLGVWGVPFSIVEAVAFHHQPSAIITGSREVLAVLHIIDALVEAGPNLESIPGLDMEFVKSGPWCDALPRWRELLATELPVIAMAGSHSAGTVESHA